jgi:cell division transport system permease protein
MLRRIYYIIDEALRTVKRHKGLTSISIVIMSLRSHARRVPARHRQRPQGVAEAQEEMKIYVYLDDRTGQGAIEGLYRAILERDEVQSVDFVSKDQALADFRDQLGDGADMLSALRVNPLPNAFHVEPRPEFRIGMRWWPSPRIQMSGVEEVRYGREFIDKFQEIVRGIYYIDFVVGFIVILSAVFIIANAVRLTVISRRKTIEILNSSGRRIIYRGPFVIEGAFQGGWRPCSRSLLRLVTEKPQRHPRHRLLFDQESSCIS